MSTSTPEPLSFEPTLATDRLSNQERRLEALEVTETNTVGRVSALEDRVTSVELVVSRVPGLESRVLRIERTVMVIQGEIRAAEKAAEKHRKNMEEKMSELVEAVRLGFAQSKR